MNSDHHTSNWLFESQLAPFVDAFMLHMFDCRYASNTINNYLAGLAHFAHWITLGNIDVKSINEKLIGGLWKNPQKCSFYAMLFKMSISTVRTEII